jgi:hypothetical protein
MVVVWPTAGGTIVMIRSRLVFRRVRRRLDQAERGAQERHRADHQG